MITWFRARRDRHDEEIRLFLAVYGPMTLHRLRRWCPYGRRYVGRAVFRLVAAGKVQLVHDGISERLAALRPSAPNAKGQI